MCGEAAGNRAMSLDGFIAAPGHVIDWILEFAASARRLASLISARRLARPASQFRLACGGRAAGTGE